MQGSDGCSPIQRAVDEVLSPDLLLQILHQLDPLLSQSFLKHPDIFLVFHAACWLASTNLPLKGNELALVIGDLDAGLRYRLETSIGPGENHAFDDVSSIFPSIINIHEDYD